MPPVRLPAVGPSVVQRVLLVDRYERATGHTAYSNSLPGHLIQCTIGGRTHHEVSGRRYTLHPGCVMWFHEDETVKVRVDEGPYRFYTVNFVAPALAPPPFEQRLRVLTPAEIPVFEALLTAWRDMAAPPAVRELRVQARLAEMLATVASHHAEQFRLDPTTEVWWRFETLLRQDLAQPITLDRMAELSGKSPATLARACRVAVGMPPLRRIKHIRMSLARGLVQRSDLTMSEIAARIGYGRVHEFSRDYRKHFGRPPTQDRGGVGRESR